MGVGLTYDVSYDTMITKHLPYPPNFLFSLTYPPFLWSRIALLPCVSKL